MDTPNGCKEFVYVGILNGSRLKVKGYDKCQRCNVGINFADKHSFKLPEYVEIECPNCGLFNRLPVFKEEEVGYGGECAAIATV